MLKDFVMQEVIKKIKQDYNVECFTEKERVEKDKTITFKYSLGWVEVTIKIDKEAVPVILMKRLADNKKEQITAKEFIDCYKEMESNDEFEDIEDVDILVQKVYERITDGKLDFNSTKADGEDEE